MDKDLLEELRKKVRCAYISDLRIEKYNKKVKTDNDERFWLCVLIHIFKMDFISIQTIHKYIKIPPNRVVFLHKWDISGEDLYKKYRRE